MVLCESGKRSEQQRRSRSSKSVVSNCFSLFSLHLALNLAIDAPKPDPDAGTGGGSFFSSLGAVMGGPGAGVSICLTQLCDAVAAARQAAQANE